MSRLVDLMQPFYDGMPVRAFAEKVRTFDQTESRP